jgi:CubicO group peptidase (beta-lactamase class C family)
MTSRFLALFAFVGIACACGGEDPPAHAELESFIESQALSAGIPGLAAALIARGELEWTGTFGYADIEAKRLVDEHTTFLVASLSKTVVALLMMQLADAGRLQLDQPIDGPLGFELRHPGHPGRSITPAMLVTHTSGIVDDFLALGAVTTDGDSEVSLADFARDYTSDAAHFGGAPGTDFSYSNSGFGILGAVVEGAAGEPLPELSLRRVFAPLGMIDSGWLLRDLDPGELAVPYSGRRQDGARPEDHQGYAFYPATSLRTSIHDLSRYLIAFMKLGVAADGMRFLSVESAMEMRVPQIPDIDRNQGIAWYYDTIGGERYLGHTGSAIGASAMMFFDPETNDGIALITNSDAFVRARFGQTDGSDALYAIAERMFAELDQSLSRYR